MSINERIFLASSHAEQGVVNVIELYENEQDATDLRKYGYWQELISDLKYPTYTAYDFTHKLFYVCDCDEILQFKIEFDQNLDTKVKATKNGAILYNVYCGGLSLDKFNNLFYVDITDKSTIRKVNRDLLLLNKYPVDLISEGLYGGESSRSAINM